MSYTETITNAKQYALLDTSTNQFVQVNTTGKFAMIHTGMPHQVIGFNYTGTATGIQVGGTIAGVTATNLDMTAGAIVSGCTAIITQIDGNIYNDKDKRCVEGLNNQTGLPQVTLYAKLLDSSNQVIAVSSAIQSPDYTFSIAPNLLDGVYSIVLDDNDSVTDAVATYPTSWKGNAQTFTIESGQIVEYLSNTANFVPMCMQSATNKPILKPTANLVGNTYNYCQGATTSSIIIDALPGAIVNWYTQLVGGVAKTTPLIPDTSVVGTTTCYVSQTLNGAESDRAEVIISVHALPDQPTAIEGNNFIAAGTTQLYSVVNSSSVDTYNWILPTDWTGSSTTKDITIVVGDKSATIGVTATSAYGCVSPIQQLDVRVVIEDDIEVYNSLSPNGDGKNDIFVIRNIDFYPENTLSIYNRWGIEVYRVNSYGQNDNFFKGFSDGRFTVSRDVELPEGAYFYTLTYKNTKGIEKNLSGYLYIKQ
jgi:gliding motility-associated-like protein